MKNNIKYFTITLSLLFLNFIGYSQTELPRINNSDDQIIYHSGYILSYNETCEQPNWVRYQVKKEDLENKVAKRKNNFNEDDNVLTGSATLEDYKGSGYDRGHLAPAATFVNDQKKMDESFYMSNMSPQDPSFNRGIWKKMEEYERSVAIEKDSVYVISGGVLNGKLKTIGENKVCVPEFFFKIIYTKDWKISFFVRNAKSNSPLYMFKQPIENIEKEAKINFMIN